jgi:hypothetical protein
MDIPTDKKTLFNYYDETLTFLPQNSFDKYNLRTIKNFIIHLDKVDSKSVVAETIYSYLTFIRTMEPITSNRQTIELFNTFIGPKAPIFERVGFMLYTRIWLLSLLTIIASSVLFFTNFSLIWCSLPHIGLVLYCILILNKKRQNKIYGIKW